jgi:hypothetical protein
MGELPFQATGGYLSFFALNFGDCYVLYAIDMKKASVLLKGSGEKDRQVIK